VELGILELPNPVHESDLGPEMAGFTTASRAFQKDSEGPGTNAFPLLLSNGRRGEEDRGDNESRKGPDVSTHVPHPKVLFKSGSV
jgi:hypothetical protein